MICFKVSWGWIGGGSGGMMGGVFLYGYWVGWLLGIFIWIVRELECDEGVDVLMYLGWGMVVLFLVVWL